MFLTDKSADFIFFNVPHGNLDGTYSRFSFKSKQISFTSRNFSQFSITVMTESDEQFGVENRY